jgi:hypothetical protein
MAFPADQQFTDQNRYGDENDTDEVDEDERTATTDANDIRKLPDIAEADGRSDGGQDKREA